MTDNDSEPQISWVPVLDQTGDDLEPMRLITFGIARHTGDGVPVPEAGGALIDRDIAELVALLNRAGVRTMQSCHDIGDACGDGCELGPLVATGEEDDDNWYTWIDRAGGEAVRFGCIVVEWDQFPALGAVLPRYYESGNNSGWLVSVHRDLRLDKWYVSVLFPWSDLDMFTDAVKAEIARQGRPYRPLLSRNETESRADIDKYSYVNLPDGKVVKNRLHLDVRVGTGLVGGERLAALEAECARLVALGAVRVRLLPADGDDESCLVMQDIEGNEFCLD